MSVELECPKCPGVVTCSKCNTWTHTIASDDAMTVVLIWCICGAANVADITSGSASMSCKCGRSWTATHGKAAE